MEQVRGTRQESRQALVRFQRVDVHDVLPSGRLWSMGSRALSHPADP
ncbi:hypothetical protein PSEWESI4_02446 [Pseudomonas carbonaria]|uniref:Uncharacterized protein n=1 Tax=Zestomonas carbonaria TaxID=2762745 RepID=A0A7U7I9F6_9GAMM|nr:hypothetical protein PSEWESI4_02446 [Pseudomonas carbonaria]